MDSACIFCTIANGGMPAGAPYRDDDVVAIEDLHPQAPSHLLVMPVRHYANLGELLAAGDRELTHKLFAVASRLGRDRGGDDGFRLVVNTGPDGGQTVGHLHLHVLAGRNLTWPPG